MQRILVDTSFWIATFDKPLITAASKLEIGIP